MNCKRYRTLAVAMMLTAAMTLMLAGCGAKEASSPDELAANIKDARTSSPQDLPALLSQVQTTSKEQEDAIDAFNDMYDAGIDFGEALEDEFGENEMSNDIKSADSDFSDIAVKDATDDSAIIVISYKSKPDETWDATNVDGRWMIKFDSCSLLQELPTTKIKGMTDAMNSMKGNMSDYKSIEEVQQAMFAAVMGGMDLPEMPDMPE